MRRCFFFFFFPFRTRKSFVLFGLAIVVFVAFFGALIEPAERHSPRSGSSFRRVSILVFRRTAHSLRRSGPSRFLSSPISAPLPPTLAHA
jgi:hypothetical protein